MQTSYVMVEFQEWTLAIIAEFLGFLYHENHYTGPMTIFCIVVTTNVLFRLRRLRFTAEPHSGVVSSQTRRIHDAMLSMLRLIALKNKNCYKKEPILNLLSQIKRFQGQERAKFKGELNGN